MKTKKCKPVLVETKDDTSSLWSYKRRKLYYNQANFNNPDAIIYYQLVLVSLEYDEVEIGDMGLMQGNGIKVVGVVSFDSKHHTWNLTTKKGSCYPFSTKDYFGKVIATQDQISSEYIEKFVEQYNTNKVEDIEVEMELVGHSVTLGIYNYEPKLTNGFVTIIEKEPILYTEEEVWKLLTKQFDYLEYGLEDMTMKEWFEQNKKK